MKYNKETTNLNQSLRHYAQAIIKDSNFKNNWKEEVLEIFISDFIRDEIQIGRIKAKLNLIKNLETEYNFT